MSYREQTNISEHLTNKQICTLLNLIIQNIIFSLHMHLTSEQTSLKYFTECILEQNINIFFYFVPFRLMDHTVSV
jgi:hypothetical protein